MDARSDVMRGSAVAFVLGFVLVASLGSGLAQGASQALPQGLAAHAPILIDGNANFTGANGVTGGNGTAAAPFMIQGWTISALSGDGVHVRNTNAYFEILGVDVSGGGQTYDGVLLENVVHGAVAFVNASNGAYGVRVDGSADVIVRTSNAQSNLYDGFFTQNSVNVTFRGDSASGNGAYGFHFFLTSGGGVENGTASGNGWNSPGTRTEMLFEGAGNVTVQGCVLPTSPTDAIYFAGTQGGRVLGNTVSDHLTAVYSDRSPGLLVRGNTLVGNIQAVYTNADNLTVMDNDFVNSTLGVVVFGASGARFLANRFSSPIGYAIQLYDSLNATLQGNAFTGASLGLVGTEPQHFDSHAVALDNAVNGKPLRYYARCGTASAEGVPAGELIVANCSRVVASNLSIGPTGMDVLLAFVGNATLTGNLLHDSVAGLVLLNTTDVWAYHNAFLNDQSPVLADRGQTWDAGYPQGGNYWSAASGTDECSGPRQDVCPDPDGILDTPVSLGAVGVDRYPLVRPWDAAQPSLFASFTATPRSGDTTTSFAFNASTSTDPNGPDAAIEVRWDFDGDGVWDTGWTTDKVVAHTYASPGSYDVKLEVGDFRGLVANTTVTVAVSPGPIDWSSPGVLLPLGAVAAVGALAVAVVLWRRRRPQPPLAPPKSPGKP